MTNWQTKKLGDVLEKIEGGGTPSKEKKEFWNGSIPWASVKDLTSFNPKETQDYITDEGLKNSSSRLVKAGTLITPTRMALGFTVRFDVDVAINQDLKALYPIDDVSTEYIQYWFEAYRKSIERLGTGSTVAGIQIGELRALKIQVPEKPEQERIVGVLEVWDEYIEKLEQKIALKEQLKKGLMQ
ncbi:MAG: restriction endonuclease subunit S, partial [Negativicutes bacterium]|nr:restriction endonuclease subunit S [Negativicutes bacterium]